jgi:hypothetical protein
MISGRKRARRLKLYRRTWGGNFVAWQGTFRSRTGAARMFRLVTTTQGQATLTQSGFDALDGSGKSTPRALRHF